MEFPSKEAASRNAMTLRFAFSSPAHVIATFLGSGVLRPAPGTWGTAAALLVYFLLNPWINTTGWILILFASFFVGAWASELTGKDLGVHDHGSIVIDEVFALWLILFVIPERVSLQILAFFVFRFFDIVKIPPARYFDRNAKWKNGWGVMLDDAVAAGQSIIILFLIKALLY